MEELPYRETVRLQNIDYNESGAYFITICTHNRNYIFGNVENSVMYCNAFGEIAIREIEVTNKLRQSSGVSIVSSVVMPNHVHLLIELNGCRLNGESDVGTQRAVSAEKRKQYQMLLQQSIPVIVRAYKAAVTKQIRELCSQPKLFCGHSTLCPYINTGMKLMPVWQSRYYEHVVRCRQDYHEIADYIMHNPERWEADKLK